MSTPSVETAGNLGKDCRSDFGIQTQGVPTESICTVLLFVVDERLSISQTSQIIALEERLAPRDISATQAAAILKEISPFPGQEYVLQTYMDLNEPFSFSARLYSILTFNAKWKVSFPGGIAPLTQAGVEGIQVVVDPDADGKAIDALVGLMAGLISGSDLVAVAKKIRTPNKNTKYVLVGTKPTRGFNDPNPRRRE